jgi:hypothetical protein
MTRATWLELLLLTAVAAVAAAAVPLQVGMWSWSWDALNHHVYLGLIAENPRWHLDVVAASVQSWQYPYLYWPVYRLSELEISGAVAGAIWSAGLALLLTPPLWVLSWRLLRDDSQGALQLVFERIVACLLAGASVVVLTALNTTANDPLAVVPLLWALALMAKPAPSDGTAALAAALWGVSVAFKLSHLLAFPLLLLWWWTSAAPRLSIRRGLAMGAAALGAFVLVYAPWGWQLWRVTGSPLHPLIPGSGPP